MVSPVSVASVKGTEFAAMINPSGVDQFIGKEGLFDVFNSVSGQTVSVGPGQKALSGSSGSLMQAPAGPDEYPKDPEFEQNLEENKKPSERDEIEDSEETNDALEIKKDRKTIEKDMPEGIENESGEVDNESSTDSKADSPDAPKNLLVWD